MSAMFTTIPNDSQLLPLSSGQLLVSSSHSLFCRIPPSDVALVNELIAGRAPLESLSEELRRELDRHGFFGDPRPLERDEPTVQIQLTNECNLACSYCCTNSGAPRSSEVTFERMQRVVRDVRELLGPGGRVSLLGGEPFLVPWAIDLAELAVDIGLNLVIFTNGMLLVDEALAARVAALNRRGAELRVSLGGPTAELCDAVSGTPRFEIVLAALDGLARLGAEVVVDMMVLPQHVSVLAQEIHRLRARLPAGARISLGLLYLSGRERGEHLFASRGELEAALDRIAFEGGELIAAPETAPLTHRREGCGCAMGTHLHVRSDGALFSCFKMEEQVGHLAEVEFTATARQMRSSPHPVSELATCAGCPLDTLCGAGCRSDNLLYTGGPEPVCGPWRVRVLSELLAEERVTAVDWPLDHLLAEAHERGIEAPSEIIPARRSRHLID